MLFFLRKASYQPMRVNARLKENLDAEDIPDAGDHLLIEEDFPDFPDSLTFQSAKELLDGEIGSKGVRPQISPFGVLFKLGSGKELYNRR